MLVSIIDCTLNTTTVTICSWLRRLTIENYIKERGAGGQTVQLVRGYSASWPGPGLEETEKI